MSIREDLISKAKSGLSELMESYYHLQNSLHNKDYKTAVERLVELAVIETGTYRDLQQMIQKHFGINDILDPRLVAADDLIDPLNQVTRQAEVQLTEHMKMQEAELEGLYGLIHGRGGPLNR